MSWRLGEPTFSGDPDNPLNVGIEVPDSDLRLAGKILHAAHQHREDQPRMTGKKLDPGLLEQVAHVVIHLGAREARAWVLGYYYTTGVRNHDTVTALLQVLR